MSSELPTEHYAYRRVDTGRIVILAMTIREKQRREFLPGRLLLEDGVLADRDPEVEAAAAASRGALNLAHWQQLRAQLEALGS